MLAGMEGSFPKIPFLKPYPVQDRFEVSSFMPNRMFYFVTLEGSIVALLMGTAAMIFLPLGRARLK
jgi:hypothetical protein